jgi:glycolate oxidase FAD binding subunit
VARRIDLAVSLKKLDRIIEYPASDLTITVEAGITIKKLHEVLAQQEQMLPLDVPFSETATLGGTLATNLNGPRRLGYGAWRDIVIGMEFVTADGKRAKGGGRVVKNVAGYDLPKLHIGAFGTLGIITEVSLKVFPIPPTSSTFAFGYASLAEAGAAAQAVRGSQLFPQALQLFDNTAAQIAGLASPFMSAYTLLASFAGPSVLLGRAQRDLPELLQDSGAVTHLQLSAEEEAVCWKAVAELAPAFLSQQKRGIVVKASLPLKQVAQYCAETAASASRGGVSAAISVQAGLGIAYLHLWSEKSNTENMLMRLAEESIRDVERLGGRGLVEWFPAEFDGKMNPWGILRDDSKLMRRIKEELDPKGILNPGRFYSGI